MLKKEDRKKNWTNSNKFTLVSHSNCNKLTSLPACIMSLYCRTHTQKHTHTYHTTHRNNYFVAVNGNLFFFWLRIFEGYKTKSNKRRKYKCMQIMSHLQFGFRFVWFMHTHTKIYLFLLLFLDDGLDWYELDDWRTIKKWNIAKQWNLHFYWFSKYNKKCC